METKAQERPALLSQRQAGEILGLSRMSMQRLIAAGSLEPVHIAGLKRPRYRTADLETLVREGRAS